MDTNRVKQTQPAGLYGHLIEEQLRLSHIEFYDDVSCQLFIYDLNACHSDFRHYLTRRNNDEPLTVGVIRVRSIGESWRVERSFSSPHGSRNAATCVHCIMLRDDNFCHSRVIIHSINCQFVRPTSR